MLAVEGRCSKCRSIRSVLIATPSPLCNSWPLSYSHFRCQTLLVVILFMLLFLLFSKHGKFHHLLDFEKLRDTEIVACAENSPDNLLKHQLWHTLIYSMDWDQTYNWKMNIYKIMSVSHTYDILSFSTLKSSKADLYVQLILVWSVNYFEKKQKDHIPSAVFRYRFSDMHRCHHCFFLIETFGE